MNARRLARVIAGVALFATPITLVAQGAQNRAAQLFDMREVMIPMRDGVKLHTKIFVPKNLTTDLPFIMARTPYGIRGTDGVFNVSYAELADEGYIFAFQDIRGRFESEGEFIMLRNPRD